MQEIRWLVYSNSFPKQLARTPGQTISNGINYLQPIIFNLPPISRPIYVYHSCSQTQTRVSSTMTSSPTQQFLYSTLRSNPFPSLPFPFIYIHPQPQHPQPQTPPPLKAAPPNYSKSKNPRNGTLFFFGPCAII